MKEKYGDAHPKKHVEEVVEEKANERSAQFCEGEEDPVVEVANVVVLICALKGEEGEISRDEVADEARHQ